MAAPPPSTPAGTGAPLQPPAGPPGVPAPGMPAAPPPVPAKKKGMSRGGKIALILTGCALVLIIIAVVLAVVFFASVITAPADVSNNYVKALNSGDLATAWTYISSGTQKEETRSGFESKIGALKGQISKWNVSSVNVQSGGQATVVMDLTLTDGTKITWDITLVKENGEWKIAQVAPRT
jgi:hypothetical protein